MSNPLEQLDALCELIKDSDIQADLEFDEARLFMNSILRSTPMMHVIICEIAEENYQAIIPSEITGALLNPDKAGELLEMFQSCITYAVNEQISDCINHNAINEPDPNEDWQDRLESRIGVAG